MQSFQAWWCWILLVAATLSGCATVEKKAKPLKCRTFAIVPPSHPDSKVSRYIARFVAKQLKQKMRKCDKFLDPGDTEEVWALMNVTHAAEYHLADMGEQQAERIIERVNATHALQIRFKHRKNRLTILPDYYRLDPLQKDRFRRVSQKMSFPLPSNHPLRDDPEKKFLLLGLELLPNSLQIGYSSNQFSNRRVDDEEIEEISVKRNAILPPIISSIQFSNVDHPYGFNTWDASARWFGSLTATYVDNEYVLLDRRNKNEIDPEGEDEPYYEDYSIEFFAVSPEINGEVSLHTLLGQTYFSLGLGIGFYTYTDTFGASSGLVTTVPIRVGQRGFVSDRVYLDFHVAVTSLSTDRPENRLFRTGSTGGGFLGIGYYFPDAKTYLRDAL